MTNNEALIVDEMICIKKINSQLPNPMDTWLLTYLL
jgi:hypothetical protein